MKTQITPLHFAAQLAAKSRELAGKRDEAILVASQAGFTLREIGDATDLSHTTIKRILDKKPNADQETPMRDEWTKYRDRYTQRPETFDAYVDVWQRIPDTRVRFTGWTSFSQAANAEPAQHSDRVAAAEECMGKAGYRLGPSTKRGARRWFPS